MMGMIHDMRLGAGYALLGWWIWTRVGIAGSGVMTRCRNGMVNGEWAPRFGAASTSLGRVSADGT